MMGICIISEVIGELHAKIRADRSLYRKYCEMDWEEAGTRSNLFFEKKSNYLKHNNKSKGNYFKYKTTKITLTWHINKIISLRK